MITQEQWDAMHWESGNLKGRDLNIWMLPCIVELRYKGNDHPTIEVYVEIEADRFFYGFGEDGIKRRYYKNWFEFIGLAR